jgi:ABC-type Zn uptake system ZnuABC Zn-binding protein ZnuA
MTTLAILAVVVFAMSKDAKRYAARIKARLSNPDPESQQTFEKDRKHQ